MRRETAWGFDHHEPAQTLTNLGFVAANRGRLREATDDFIHARQEALASGDTDFAAGTALYLAAVQLEVGEIAAADATLRQVEGNAFDPGDTAFFRADLGDLTAARAEIAKIESSGTRSTLQLRFDLPLLKGLLALKTGKAAEAVKDFDPSRKYQLRDYGIPYQRARAEVAAGMLDKAAEDYHLILANPGIDPLWTNYSLSHLGLARVYALQKKYSESRTEYQTFLSSWKEGDPDVPLLIQVKEEYAKLPLR
jgi:tetratricopeptide (TPR) repeat protein